MPHLQRLHRMYGVYIRVHGVCSTLGVNAATESASGSAPCGARSDVLQPVAVSGEYTQDTSAKGRRAHLTRRAF